MTPYVLSERDYLLLKRDHYTLQRELSNLKRSIARGPVRKHQGRSAPPPQIVQVWSSGSSVGASIAVNADGLFPGRIRFLIDSTWNTGGDVWIEIIDDGVTLTTTASNGKYYPGTLSGTFTSGGTTAPLYLVTPRGTSSSTTGTPFYNDSGEAIPPYAIMFIAGDTRTISGTRYIEVGKPGSPVATFDIHWLVNGASTIPAATIANDPAATGTGSWLSETNGGIVAVGEAVNVGDEFGPKPASWYGWKGRPGFAALEGSYTDGSSNVVVAAKQRDVVRVFGRLYSALTQNAAGNATAQFEIWHRNTSGSRYPAGWDHVTVYGTLMNNGDSSAAGTFGYADYSTIGTGSWEVDPACDPDNTNTSQSSYASQGFQFFGPPSPASVGGAVYGGSTGTAKGF